nr:hypothetical protein [Chroococcidiopsis cubana]
MASTDNLQVGFFVALDVDGSRERQGWVVWEEDGRYPDVIVELLSPSTAKVDRGVKKICTNGCSVLQITSYTILLLPTPYRDGTWI